MVGAMVEKFSAQRDRIIANLDPTRIGKSYGKKVKGKQPVYTRKDWLRDLIDWAAAAESFEAAIAPTVHAALLQSGRDAMQEVTDVLKASIRYSLDHRAPAVEYALRFGRDLDRQLADRFVGMYVNHWTVDYGPKGREAISLLLREGARAGLVPEVGEVEYVDASECADLIHTPDSRLPLSASNVMIVCPNCSRPTRVGHSRLESGVAVRVCKHCGEGLNRAETVTRGVRS